MSLPEVHSYALRQPTPEGERTVWEGDSLEKAKLHAVGHPYCQIFDTTTGEHVEFGVDAAIAVLDAHPMTDYRNSHAFPGMFGWQIVLEIATRLGREVPARTARIAEFNEAIGARMAEVVPTLGKLVTNERVIRSRLQQIVRDMTDNQVELRVEFGEDGNQLRLEPDYRKVTIDG